jgi:hypothetical protein
MKFVQALSLAALVALPAFGQAVLVQKIGSIANLSGRADICEIHENHPDLKGVDVQALITEAAGEPLTKALHFRAEVPSKEITAIKVVHTKGPSPRPTLTPVLLLRDYSEMQTRAGKAAQELIELTQKLCK